MKRRAWSVSLIVLYSLMGVACVQYLRDTKYKAIGTENPYKPITPVEKSKIVEAHDTTPVYQEIAADFDAKVWKEEAFSYVWWMRRRLMKHIKGDCLEVSCGTGRNIPYIKLAKREVNSLTFLDSSPAMLEIAKQKFTTKYPEFSRVQFVCGRAEDIVALAAKSGQMFDTVYESFGLCSHEDPGAALENMRKVLRKGGKIVLLEHGRGSFESMNRRLDDRAAERAKEWGCRWNLDIQSIVKKSGLEIEEEGRYHFGTVSFYVLSEPDA